MRLITCVRRKLRVPIAFKQMSCNFNLPCSTLETLLANSPRTWLLLWITLTKCVRLWWHNCRWWLNSNWLTKMSKAKKMAIMSLVSSSKWWNEPITLRSSGKKSATYARVTTDRRFKTGTSSLKNLLSTVKLRKSRLRSLRKFAIRCMHLTNRRKRTSGIWLMRIDS